MMQKLSLILISIGRVVAKKLHLEENPFVLFLHRIVLYLGFSRLQDEVRISLFDHGFILAKDLSLLPGLLNKTYEKFELEYVRDHLQTGQCFIDIGANFGLYSVLAANIVGPSGKVVAFEPVPKTFDFLRRNTLSLSQVLPVPCAVGDKEGPVHFYFNQDKPGCSSALAQSNQSLTVSMVKLDDYLEHMKLPRPDFIKIDVEGFEYEVLQGIDKCLSPHTTIMCEFNPSFLSSVGRDPSDFLNYLKSRFGKVTFIVEQTGELKEIHSVEDLSGQIVSNLIVRKK